jgi:hypothetical protein
MQLHSSQLSAVPDKQQASRRAQCLQVKHMRIGRPITDVLADNEFLQFVESAPSVGVTELNRYSYTDISVGQPD